jgi:hypothetical protein
MSRTYRAKSGNQFWRGKYRSCWTGDSWGDTPEGIVKYWESDIPNRLGIVKVATKRQFREVSRADTRAELGLILKDEEHDFYNREKLYKGFSWNWD